MDVDPRVLASATPRPTANADPPAGSELWRCSPRDGRPHPSVSASTFHIFIFFSVSAPPLSILHRSSLNVRI